MKFSTATPDVSGQEVFRLVSTGGTVVLAVVQVMFGYRVQGFFAGEMTMALDWCGGADPRYVGLLMDIAESILELRTENRDVFKGLPARSDVKPAYMDLPFVTALVDAGGRSTSRWGNAVRVAIGNHQRERLAQG